MPRSSPVADFERGVGARVAEARRAQGFSRVSFAEGIFPTAETLARIELGRVPLYYGVARKIWQRMPQLNPLFVALGSSPVRLDIELFLPEPSEIGVTTHTLFTEAILRFEDDLSTLWGAKSKRRLPLSWIPAQRFYIDYKRMELQKLAARLDYLERSIGKIESTSKLFHESACVTNSQMLRKDMQSEIPRLLANIKRLTRTRGAKAELARFLGVSQASVSEWLSGRKEPNGETAIRLLRWVERPEAK